MVARRARRERGAAAAVAVVLALWIAGAARAQGGARARIACGAGDGATSARAHGGIERPARAARGAAGVPIVRPRGMRVDLLCRRFRAGGRKPLLLPVRRPPPLQRLAARGRGTRLRGGGAAGRDTG